MYLFSPNTGKYVPEITPYLNTSHAVQILFWTMLQILLTYSTCRVKNMNSNYMNK